MKARKLALLALVLGMASCQKDFAPGFLSEGEVGVKLSVVAPDLLTATRTDGDAKANLDSAYGAIDYLDGSVAGDDRFDWNDVDIRYSLEVYDAEDLEEPIKDRMVIIKDKYEPVMFDLRLIPGREYQFAIFADFVPQGEAAKEVDYSKQGDLGLRHTIGDYLTDITIKQGVDALNDEVADAYFKSFKYTPDDNTYNSVKDIVLTRPYAKLRVVATDLADLNLNVHPKYINVKYDSEVVIPTTFNAVTGSIAGDKVVEKKTLPEFEYVDFIRDNRSEHTYNADNDAKTTIADNGAVRASHLTLFTDYILAVGGEHTPVSFTMTVEDAAGETIKKVEFNTQIPIERNFLTTIVGNVLTTETEVEVTINDDFKGYYDYDSDKGTLVETLWVDDHNELVEAIKPENLFEGTNIIKFANDIIGDIVVPEIEGKAVVIDGNGQKFTGCIVLNGGSSYKGEGTVIENVNFVTSDSSALQSNAFIYCNDKDGGNRYPDNLIVRNCTFTDTAVVDDEVDNAVGIKLRALGNASNPRSLNIENCSANGVHSLVQLQSCGAASVCIDGVTITNSKNGVSLEKSDFVIRNSNISALCYGVRADGSAANAVIENTTIAAAQPVIVRKVTADGYNLSFVGENTLTPATEGDYQVIFTNDNDDKAYVVPTGTYTLVDDNKFKAYPRNMVDGIQYDGVAQSFVLGDAADATSFAVAVNNGFDFAGFTVELTGNVDLAGQNWTPAGTEENQFRGTFDGKDYTISNLTIDGGDNVAMFAYAGDNVTIKSLTLENIDVKGGSYVAGLVCNAGENLVVENVTVSGTVEATGYAAGFIWKAKYNVLKNCKNYATISGNRGAGLVAWINSTSSVMENVANYGDITGNISAAGISNRIAGTVKNAVNYGTIKGNGTEASAGISGTSTDVANFEYCYNYGNVTTTTDNPNSSAAGILGQTPSKAATFNYCANYGAITAEQSYAAGIGYSLYGNIKANYCYNAGAVNGADGAGAIAPKAQYGANDTANCCLNAGEITSAKKVYQGSNKNTNSFYYSNGELWKMNLEGKKEVVTLSTTEDALAVLNGGADADFFVVENDVIIVK